MTTLSSTLTSYPSNNYKICPVYLPSPPEKYNPYSISSKRKAPGGSLPSIETLLLPSPKLSSHCVFMPETSKFVPIDQPLSIITDETYLNAYYDPYYQLPPGPEKGDHLLQLSKPTGK